MLLDYIIEDGKSEVEILAADEIVLTTLDDIIDDGCEVEINEFASEDETLVI